MSERLWLQDQEAQAWDAQERADEEWEWLMDTVYETLERLGFPVNADELERHMPLRRPGTVVYQALEELVRTGKAKRLPGGRYEVRS